MTQPTKIVNGGSSPGSWAAIVSKIGQLITAPYAYDETSHNELGEINTAYNFYTPKVGCQFVITGLYYSADQQVSATSGAEVIIYEATAGDSTTVSKVLHQDDMVRNDRIQAKANILVSEGVYINAKTSDDDIHMTITGYYIPKLTD